MSERERLSKYVGKEVRLKPFPKACWYIDRLYYNEDMSKAVNEKSPMVKVMSLERIGDHYEFIALFADGQRWYIMESWIEQVGGGHYLFI